MTDVPPVDIPRAAAVLGITEQQVRDLMAEGVLTPLAPPEITATNMIQPPPCGHMNGTHPYDCWWTILGDEAWEERQRIREAVEELDTPRSGTTDAEYWGVCETNGWEAAIAAVLRIIDGETP